MVFAWMAFDPYFLRLLPVQTNSLIILGRVKAIEGKVFRKLRSESLRVPLIEGDRLFEGDTITTETQSRLEIGLSPEASLVVPADASIRLFSQDGKIGLHLLQGEMLTELNSDLELYLSSGLQNELVKLFRGSTIIKGSQKGLVWELVPSAILAEPLLAGINIFVNTKYEYERIQAFVDHPEPWAKKEKVKPARDISSDKLRLGAGAIPSTFPQPEHKLVYLMTNNDTIRIAARPVCEDVCKLKIKRDRVLIAEEKFKRGEIPIYDLRVDSATVSSFEWTYSDQDYVETFDFQVLPFTQENFQKTMKNGWNVEVR